MAGALDIRIEKLVYGGEGLGRIEGRAVLVPLVLPGERVAAQPVKEQPRLIRARLEQVLEPSPGRIPPGCPYFTRCGGCHYQHTGYEQQLRHKAAILRESLQRIGKIAAPEPEVTPSPPWNYRNRTQFKTEKRSGTLEIGYFEMGSHRLLPVDLCPISSPRINALIPQLRELGKRPDFPGGSGEIEAFVSHDDASVLLNVTALGPWPETLVGAAREIIPDLASLSVSEPAGRPPRVFGRGHILYRAAEMDFRVSHGSFFQTNRLLADSFAQQAVDGLAGDTAVELFSGVGYFTLRLARAVRRVIAVEANPAAVRDLESNRNRAGAQNIDSQAVSSAEYLEKRAARKQPRPDAVFLDPPRAGLGRRAAEHLAALGAPAIVYVSCDPATLGRDLAALIAHGYRLARLRLVDLFPQTFHIESIATLERD